MANNIPYPIINKTRPTFIFIGVTTSKSSIMKVFPRWMEALGRPEVVIEGIDHKIHDKPEAYRRTVAQMKYDPLSLGALVTTHKIDLLTAARDMFDQLHESSRLTGEVSSISKRGEQLWGHAMDPLTSGLSMDAFLGGLLARVEETDRTRLQLNLYGLPDAVRITIAITDTSHPTRRKKAVQRGREPPLVLQTIVFLPLAQLASKWSSAAGSCAGRHRPC